MKQHTDTMTHWRREAEFQAATPPPKLHDRSAVDVEEFRARQQNALREWNYRR